MSYLIAIETAVPEYCHQQKDITSYFIDEANEQHTKRKLKFISEKSGIDYRYSVVNDFSHEQQFFRKGDNPPTIEDRMALYQSEALPLAIKAIKKINGYNNDITHLITVTCTGLFAPGLDIQLINALNLPSYIERNSVNFMGCNAAILALKQAKSICDSASNAKVLIVCVELCTIHFQNNQTDDDILANTLFGDGAAACIVSSLPNKNAEINLKLNSFNSLIIPKGYHDMAWQLSSKGFIMNLTSYISELINGNMVDFLKNIQLEKQQIDYWAIHPGGKKIVDDFAITMHLEKKDLQASYDVLQQFGNMSSPTILFVLKTLVESISNPIANQTIFVASFGPGITLESMQLQYV